MLNLLWKVIGKARGLMSHCGPPRLLHRPPAARRPGM